MENPADQEQHAPETLADAITELGHLSGCAGWYARELQRRIDDAGLTLDTISLADLAATVRRDRGQFDIRSRARQQEALL